ncbi:MAG: hypothetical protein QME74_05925 [Candidatus Edwardsbacteria bacterium]|nr:hypothetical protein [Candidatus Edwardsbacteria bacterium]
MPEMNEAEQIKEAVKRWREAGPALEAERHDRIRETDVAFFVDAMDGMVRIVLEQSPPSDTSGLLEQQAIFRRSRRC